jgi:hypothetical protein
MAGEGEQNGRSCEEETLGEFHDEGTSCGAAAGISAASRASAGIACELRRA